MFEEFKKIGERIYVLENFMTQEEMDFICKKLDVAIWTKHPYETVTPAMEESAIIIEKLKKILGNLKDQLTINTAFRKFVKGESMGIHHDANYNPDIEWGIIVYLNSFDGGQLYYKNQDITYQGKAGDLVIHGADKLCTHQVLEVKSNIRYTYLSDIRRKQNNE